MIGSLRGTVLERFTPSTVLIEVAGGGDLCSVTTSPFMVFSLIIWSIPSIPIA